MTRTAAWSALQRVTGRERRRGVLVRAGRRGRLGRRSRRRGRDLGLRRRSRRLALARNRPTVLVVLGRWAIASLRRALGLVELLLDVVQPGLRLLGQLLRLVHETHGRKAIPAWHGRGGRCPPRDPRAPPDARPRCAPSTTGRSDPRRRAPPTPAASPPARPAGPAPRTERRPSARTCCARCRRGSAPRACPCAIRSSASPATPPRSPRPAPQPARGPTASGACA